jgi:hypothetical protein
MIYIDAILGDSRKGEDLARELGTRGFKSLHLTTGLDSNEFIGLEFIKSVIGKEFPYPYGEK